MTPECLVHKWDWYQPNLIVGACIDMIGNDTVNPVAPREGVYRVVGFGKDCNWDNETTIVDNKYPLWGTTDFRVTCGKTRRTVVQPSHQIATAKQSR
jgi:hypothetical protein